MLRCVKSVLTLWLVWVMAWSSMLHAEPKLNLTPGFAPEKMSEHHRQKKMHERENRQKEERREKRGGAFSVSLDQAIRMAEKRYGGKALSAKRIRGQGPAVFKVKLLSKGGRVSAVYVDATTGDVFKTR